jgi:hypothetical protein
LDCHDPTWTILPANETTSAAWSLSNTGKICFFKQTRCIKGLARRKLRVCCRVAFHGSGAQVGSRGPVSTCGAGDQMGKVCCSLHDAHVHVVLVKYVLFRTLLASAGNWLLVGPRKATRPLDAPHYNCSTHQTLAPAACHWPCSEQCPFSATGTVELTRQVLA